MMNNWQLGSYTLLFGMLIWLGFYLIARDPRRLLLWFAGLALIALASAVALSMLNQLAFSVQLAFQLVRVERLLILGSAPLGLAALVTLVPHYKMWTHRWQTQKAQIVLAWTGMLGFSVGAGLLILGGLVPQIMHLSLMAVSFLVMGTAVSMIHAADQGETWLPHFFRSFDYAFFTAVLFGGQVVLMMTYAVGVTFPMVLLLLGTVTTSILVQVFSDPVQAALDQVAFFNTPFIRHKRSELRAESGAAQRVDTSLDLLKMDEDTFTRHTRQALSHLGNLPKLAASPLTNLPLVVSRLGQNGRTNSTLARAHELQQILTESIQRLKPPGEETFGITDAWRHYNALYFPYVAGLRPYSRRYFYERNGTEDTAVQEALHWFRAQVPERTLYNWQNAAAQLIARDLHERSRQL